MSNKPATNQYGFEMCNYVDIKQLCEILRLARRRDADAHVIDFILDKIKDERPTEWKFSVN